MALGTLPPWLDVTPSQYLEAARSGGSLGLQIAEQGNRADQAAAERGLRAWEAQQQMQARSQQLAAEREHWQGQLTALEHGHQLNADVARERIAEADRYHQLREQSLLSRNYALAAHYQQMEDKQRLIAEKASQGATVVKHPETGDQLFLHQPTGHEQVLVGPGGKGATPEQEARIAIAFGNGTKYGPDEGPDSPVYQDRTNKLYAAQQAYNAARGIRPPGQPEPSVWDYRNAIPSDPGSVAPGSPGYNPYALPGTPEATGTAGPAFQPRAALEEGGQYVDPANPSNIYKIVNGKPVLLPPTAIARAGGSISQFSNGTPVPQGQPNENGEYPDEISNDEEDF